MAVKAEVNQLKDGDKKGLVDSVETFIFDCDGVIWKGDFIEGVPETIAMLREMGKRLIFVTNNSTKSRAGYLKKFLGLGLEITAEEVFSSSFAAAGTSSPSTSPRTRRCTSLARLASWRNSTAGIQYLGGEADGDKKVTLSAGQLMEHDPDVAAVIVGFDRNVNYYKIQYATLCIRENPGCQFIATNTDAVTHLTDAQEWAGNGSMVGAIKGSTKREPTVVGKPAPFMLDYIANKFDIRKDQICMVGDRLDTDILFGKDGGLRTLLVLSGVTDEATLKSPENEIHPDYYTSKLADLLTIKASVNA